MHPVLTPLEIHAANRPAHLAASDQSLALHYQALCAVASGLATQIQRASERQRIGILAPTSTAGAVAVLACWYAGRTPVPLNFLLAPDELGGIVADAELDLCLTIERFAPATQAAGLKAVELNAQTLVPGRCDVPAAAGNDTGVVLYTSGTSGDPKGVCLSFDNIVSNAQAAIARARMDERQVFLSVLPQFHSFGFTQMTLTPLLLGATVHYVPRFSPVGIVETIVEKRVTIFMAIASMWAVLANLKRAAPDAFASLELAISGGEPLPPRVYETFRQRFGTKIQEGYGLTETSPVISINMPWAGKPGTVGTMLDGVTGFTVDADGNPLPAGQEGELVVRGHCVMQGYLNKPEQTAAAMLGDGLRTGDIVRIDDDGFIAITGRAKEMMIVGGENVFPREIENVLAEHPSVAEVAVIGSPDDVRGEVPLAYVILREDTAAEPADLRNFCRDRLAGFKVPREVRIARELPRAPTGKILKRALDR